MATPRREAGHSTSRERNAPARDASPQPPLYTSEFWERVGDGETERSYEAALVRGQGHPLPWRETLVGAGVGIVFAFVNVWLGMRLGFIVGLSLYLSYFLGTALRWSPSTINYAAGASTGASQVVTPIALILPALWVLGAADTSIVLLVAAGGLVAGVLGVSFFFVYRRLWLVERPLPYPGAFHASMLLMEAAAERETGVPGRSRRLLWVVLLWAGAALLFGLARDLPLIPRAAAAPVTLLDALLPSALYDAEAQALTWPFATGLFPPEIASLSLTFAAVGWFIGLRVATALLVGGLATTLLLPFAPPTLPSFILQAAFVIAGAGLALLVRNRAHLAAGLRDLLEGPSTGRDPLAPPRGQLLSATGIGLLAFAAILVTLGMGAAASLTVALLIVAAILLFGAMAVKITGETTIQALTPFAVLLILLIALLSSLLGASRDAALIVAAITLFGIGLVMATDTLFDFKMALYLGNPPREQAKAQWIGLVPGLIAGSAFAGWLLSRERIGPDRTSTELLPLPQAQTFAALATFTFPGGIGALVLLLAMGIGASIEMATGLGTLFGLGMILGGVVFGSIMTLFLAAAARWLIERKREVPVQRTLMVVAGIFIGEVVAGLVAGLAG